MINIVINEKSISVNEGETILKIAKDNGIVIPTLCYHPDLKPGASCRICLVEIEGKKGLFTSCSTIAEDGMIIKTESEAISKARKINTELLFSQHSEECEDCVKSLHCKFLDLAKKSEVKMARFPDRKKGMPVYQFDKSVVFDSSKCIDCKNCVEICEQKEVGFLELEERDGFTNVIPSKNKKKDCIFCGQCINHCPVGAFEAVGEFEDSDKFLNDVPALSRGRTKFLVFQFAPSIRSSIGEDLGFPAGTVLTGQMTAGIRRLGANLVFDTSVGADFTTFEEAKEMVARHKSGQNLPILSSCCPSWVKYIEFFRPDLIPNLATTRSPQVILGGILKTYLAKKNNWPVKDIVVVSVMPCVSKKYEIERKQVRIDGIRPVDYVITTRELAYLFNKNNIDLKTIEPSNPDDPFGDPSGAGVIYGASGGVAESVLRTAYKELTGQELALIDFEDIRGETGIKRATIKFDGTELKLAVVSGIDNAKIILNELKENPKAYHCVEVMACPGGCIGGGGQPVPTDEEIRKKRAQALYEIDSKKEIRRAHENPALKEIYGNYLTDENIIHQICHTSYSKKKKEV